MKIVFEDERKNQDFIYNGKAYTSVEYPVPAEDDYLLLRFKFRRIGDRWNQVYDFELETDEPSVAKVRNEIQNIIVTGIMGHEKGQDFAIDEY